MQLGYTHFNHACTRTCEFLEIWIKNRLSFWTTLCVKLYLSIMLSKAEIPPPPCDTLHDKAISREFDVFFPGSTTK